MPNYVQPVIDNLAARVPDCPPELLDLYAALALTVGRSTTLEQVHHAWAIWRNRTRPDHRSLVPFDQLAPEVQELDRAYMLAIHAAATAVTL